MRRCTLAFMISTQTWYSKSCLFLRPLPLLKFSSWNSDIYNEKQKQQVKNIAIKYQASAWASAGKIYSPYYRQVHYRSFYEPYTSKGGKDAGKIAYNDIKNAFEYLFVCAHVCLCVYSHVLICVHVFMCVRRPFKSIVTQ